MSDLRSVKKIKHLGGYRLEVMFDDGSKGILDLQKYVVFEGVFAPLENESEVAKAFVDPEGGVIAWPNGADLDSDGLYAHVVQKKNQPEWATATARQQSA